MFNHTLMQRRVRALLAAHVVALFVAACGGDGYGGGGGSPAAAVTLTVQPATIVLGQSATLTWSAASGAACTAGGGWSGSQASSGTQSVTPAAAGAVTYTISCSGSNYGGSRQASITLTVTAPTAYSTTSLVADTAGTSALVTDANLVNPWGVAFSPTSFAWVANNHSGTSTLYDGNGRAQPASSPLIVHLPATAGVDFDPTGIVFNGGNGFVITAAGKSAAARFIFDSESGAIGGWSSNVDPANVVTMYVDSGGAIYKGLALANNGAGDFLYATDFHNNKIDVFDATFQRQVPTATSFAFADPTLPAGYAPFGIQAIANGAGGAVQLYVSYAKQSPPDNIDDVSGPGLGLVNIFDSNGNLLKHLVAVGGALDAPWGMVLAPADFGTFGGKLLIGNFGDGKVNAYDPSSGELIGTIKDAGGTSFAVPGLWGIAFGNDVHNQPHNTLFYAAGTNDEANGVYGRIDVGATPPTLNEPPVVAVSAPASTLSGSVTLSATAQSNIGVTKVEFFANATSLGTATTAPYSVTWNTTAVADGSYSLTAKATDVNGNVGTSPAVAVTVANAAPVVTLSQLQASVFTPKCSGCHDGSNAPGGALPGSQNLTAGHTFANLVNVASLEQPGLMRVKPGDPANSYLIHKLEGTAGISGSRMPLGGPFLDQATMDSIKAWIASGAPNN